MISHPRMIGVIAKMRASDRRNRRRFGPIWGKPLPIAARLHFRVWGIFSNRTSRKEPS